MRKVLSCWECQVHKSGYKFSDSDLHLWTWRLSLIISNKYPHLFSLKWQIRFIPSEKMPAKYPTLNNSSISSKMYFLGEKSSAPSSYSCPSAPPQKSRAGLQLQPESCVQTWFHHRIQRQVSPRSRFVGIVIFLHNRPSEVKFTFLLHMPSGWGHRGSSWSLVPCLPWGPPLPRSFRSSIHQQHEPLLREEGR